MLNVNNDNSTVSKAPMYKVHSQTMGGQRIVWLLGSAAVSQQSLPIDIFSVTVKPVFKGHSDDSGTERTPCDQGTFSQNGVLSFSC